MKSTIIKAWCGKCSKEEIVEEMLFINGKVIMTLECGHEIYEKFKMF